MILSFVLFSVSCFLLSVLFTWLSLQKLQNYQLVSASKFSRVAKISLTPLQYLTFRQSSLLEAWDSALSMIDLSPDLIRELETSFKLVGEVNLEMSSEESKILSSDLVASIIQVSHHFDDFVDHVNESKLLGFFISEQRQQKLNELRQQIQSAKIIIEHFSQGEHQLVFLLHNSDEIRASGGFIGSVANFSLDQGRMSELIFYDIYDLASQTTEHKSLPVGVKLFLSGGKEGLTLTDANWEADFSQSAQDIIDLLNQTHLSRTDLLVAVNLDLIKDILEITGPITLPGYSAEKKEVTAENLSQLARENRYDFFAGDKQKKLFLKDLYTVLKIRLAQFNQEQLVQLVKALVKSAQTKQYFFYSTQPNIQEHFVKLNLAGVINPVSDFFLYPVESNVGINKANQMIDRKVDLSISSNVIVFKIEFYNNNHPLSAKEVALIKNNPDLLQADHLGYVNYFRLLSNVHFSHVMVECEDQPKKLLENNLVSTQQGQVVQLGFLVTVPEQSSATCELRLIPTQSINPNQSWTVLKQPGLPETEYNINFFRQMFKRKLNQDIIF